jgi:predicted amidophosphoribosyltransferase
MVCWNATNEETTSSMQTIATTETTGTTGTTGTTKTAHTPVIKLTELERAQKSTEHEFGICGSCDAGLDNQEDFVSSNVADSLKVRCNACYHYYAEEESFQKFIGLVHYDEWSF